MPMLRCNFPFFIKNFSSEFRAKAESAKNQSDDLYKEFHVQSDKVKL